MYYTAEITLPYHIWRKLLLTGQLRQLRPAVSFTDSGSYQNANSSFRFFPSRLLQFTLVVCCISLGSYKSPQNAVVRLIRRRDYDHARADAPVALTCRPATNGLASCMPLVHQSASRLGTALLSWWLSPCRRLHQQPFHVGYTSHLSWQKLRCCVKQLVSFTTGHQLCTIQTAT